MTWLLRMVGLVALAGFAAAVWFAGPMVGFGDARPLEPAWLRAMIIGCAALGLVAYYAFLYWRAASGARALEKAVIAGGGDGDILESRMKQAIATMKRGNGRRNFLYEVPWYLIIGPPGTGKTTALVNSGLRFALSETGDGAAVEGVGGTRYCDWWFAEDAVLIDTAGRYTTQDSDAVADRKSWLSFLAVLGKYRPKQPVNGIVVAISLSDLITLNGQELGVYVSEIRKRLAEIRDSLRVHLPVYVLFTKADLVAGFAEYFAGFDESRRRSVWGATFPPPGAGRAAVAEVPAAFDRLVRRLSEEVADRMEEEADPQARIAIFGFPAQFGLLRQRVDDFISGVFGTSSGRGETLRGFYFSSGTQEGTPVDQVLGTLARSFGSEPRQQLSGKGRSYFLHDLLTRVIFAEAGWVSYDPAAEKRGRIGRMAGLAAIAATGVVVAGAIALSFAANRALVGTTEIALAQYRQGAAPILAKAAVDQPDLETVVGPLSALRAFPTGYDNRDAPVTIFERLGLGQRRRLVAASEAAYRHALERLLRPRLLIEAEEAIQRNLSDPVALYEPLKIYLMLGGKAPKTDPDLVVAWFDRDWEQNRFPGPGNSEGRAVLARHVRAMLALGQAYDQPYRLDGRLVAAARRLLGPMSLLDRAKAVLVSSTAATSLPDFVVAERAGAQSPLVFETTDGSDFSKLRVPGIFTYDGFNRVYLDQLARIAGALKADAWVFGDANGQASVESDLARLGPELLDSYGADFARAWNSMLANLKFKPFSKDKPRYVTLSAAAASGSPIEKLFEAVARETDLTREPDAVDIAASAGPGTGPQTPLTSEERARGLAMIGIEDAGGKSQNRAGAAFAAAPELRPGARIAGQFRAYQALVDGRPGQRPVDGLVRNFRDIYQSLRLAASDPAGSERASSTLQLKIQALRLNASRLPGVLANMASAAADEFEGQAAETTIARTRPEPEGLRHRPLRGNRHRALSLLRRRCIRRAACGLRAAVRAERHHRPLLRPEPRFAGGHGRQAMEMAAGQPAGAGIVARRRSPASRWPPRSAMRSSRGEKQHRP